MIDSVKEIEISSIGMEPIMIENENIVGPLEIILTYAATYDFMSERKTKRAINRQRRAAERKRIDAYHRGIFQNKKRNYKMRYL